MSRRYKFHEQDRLHFVTYTIINWIDVFIRNEYKDIIVDSLKYCCVHKGLDIYAWCIMTNHVHLIIGTRENKLEDILRDHKKYTSEALSKAIRTNQQESRKDWILKQFRDAGEANPQNTIHQVWQQHNKPIVLYSEEIVFQYLNYIHNNPVKTGFVKHPEHWLYSSAIDYAGGKGLLDTIPIDFAIRDI